MATLQEILKTDVSALAESGSYTVYVEEGENWIADETGGPAAAEFGYWLTVSWEGKPPHARYFFTTIEAVEQYVADGEVLGEHEFDWQPNEDA